MEGSERRPSIPVKRGTVSLSTVYLLVAIESPHMDVTAFQVEALIRESLLTLVGRFGSEKCFFQMIGFCSSQNIATIRTNSQSVATLRSTITFISFFRDCRCRVRTLKSSLTLPFLTVNESPISLY
eukprot:GHVQ01032957.1.p1 GENE.GHVQ01032957.1~~GHVQ01032957.1.p1  ORF type:complete len:126 (-),score=8.65 GHVQ01032957.1:191-568(-)